MKKPSTFGPYSPIRRAGNLCFVAGQVGVDSSGEALDGFSDQFELVIQNLKSVLASEGLSLENVINVRVYLTDMSDFTKLNDSFKKHFDGIGPSRECVGVSSLPDVAKNGVKLRVEMSAVAFRD